MKRLFLVGLLSVLLYSCISSANDNTDFDQETSNRHAKHHRTHIHLKSQSIAPVDINSANESDLSTLKGIGPKKARAIIAYREANGPFKSIDDLTHIKGIGKKSVARLQTNNPGRILVDAVASNPKKSETQIIYQ